MIIDRFEGDFAVVELDNKTMVNIPKIALPKDAKEGDILIITIDVQGAKNRKELMQKKLNSMFE